MCIKLPSNPLFHDSYTLKTPDVFSLLNLATEEASQKSTFIILLLTLCKMLFFNLSGQFYSEQYQVNQVDFSDQFYQLNKTKCQAQERVKFWVSSIFLLKIIGIYNG